MPEKVTAATGRLVRDFARSGYQCGIRILDIGTEQFRHFLPAEVFWNLQVQLDSSEELVVAMESVSTVVESNQAAVDKMEKGSNTVSVAVENIASLSEENSAAIEEVSASTSEMHTQVQEVNAAAQALAEMAMSLNTVAGRFKLGGK